MMWPSRFPLIRYALLVLLAMAASYCIPPMQSPDENYHFARAYLLSKGDIFLTTVPDKMSGGYVDNSLDAFIKGNMQIAGQTNRKLSAEETIRLKNINWNSSDQRSFMEIPGTGFYFPLIYLPHAMAIKAGEAANFSIYQTYLLTRFFLITFSISLMLWAFSMVSPSMATLSFVMLPMSMFQLLSPTLDALTTSLSLVAIAIFLDFYAQPQSQSLPKKHFYILLIAIFLVATSRIHLITIILFLFMLSWNMRSRKFFCISIASTLLTALWIIFSIQTTVDNRVPRDLSSLETIKYYIFHPFDFLRVLLNTLNNQDILDFYIQSFIGRLGWLDTLLPAWHYYIFSAFIIYFLIVSCFSKNTKNPSIFIRITIFMVSFSSILVIFAALLVSWTPHPAIIIHGIQGRYFIVPALLLAYATHGIFPWRIQVLENFNKIILFLFFIFSSYSMLSALHHRFIAF